jgi:hypothetical protein
MPSQVDQTGVIPLELSPPSSCTYPFRLMYGTGVNNSKDEQNSVCSGMNDSEILFHLKVTKPPHKLQKTS